MRINYRPDGITLFIMTFAFAHMALNRTFVLALEYDQEIRCSENGGGHHGDPESATALFNREGGQSYFSFFYEFHGHPIKSENFITIEKTPVMYDKGDIDRGIHYLSLDKRFTLYIRRDVIQYEVYPVYDPTKSVQRATFSFLWIENDTLSGIGTGTVILRAQFAPTVDGAFIPPISRCYHGGIPY